MMDGWPRARARDDRKTIINTKIVWCVCYRLMGRNSQKFQTKTGARPITTPRSRAKNAQNTNTNGGGSRSNRGGTRAGTLGPNEPSPNGESAKQTRRRRQKAKKKEAIERAAKVTEAATEGLQYSADLYTSADLPKLKKMDLDFFVKNDNDCNLEIVRGADWCRPVITWEDRKCYGRNRFGPTLKEAYDTWIASGRAEEVDKHKNNYLGWIQANLS